MLSCTKVENFDQLKKTWYLTYTEFLKQGYVETIANPISYYPHLDIDGDQLYKNTSVYNVYDDNTIVGTISCTLDGESRLNTDITFADIMKNIRSEYSNIGCGWRIATDSKYRNSKKIILLLLNCVYEWVLDTKIEYLVAECNPKYALFYQKTLNMKLLSELRPNLFLRSNMDVMLGLHRNDLLKLSSLRTRLLK